MDTYSYYAELAKPTWAPPAWLFGPVWTVLYILIAASFGYIFYLGFKERPMFRLVIPFAANIIFNALFTPIQFGLQDNLLAAVDVLLVLSTLVWALSLAWRILPRRARWVVYINLPYLAWVMFASVLQITVTVLNW